MTKQLCVGFLAGAVVTGSVVWYYTKKIYEEKANQDIASVTKRFTIPKDDIFPSNEQYSDSTKNARNLREYAAKLSDEKYADYNNVGNKKSTDSKGDRSFPYVIPPEEFQMNDDYSAISLTWYADGVLAEENDQRVADVEGSVGLDAVNHFGEYEDDSVYIRNERLKTDYEILRSLKTYKEVLNEKPYLRSEV